MRQPTTAFDHPLHSQLNQLGELRELMLRVDHYAALGSKFAEQFPEVMRANVKFSCIDGTTLRFLARSAAWAMKLRLLSDNLIALAKSLGYQHVTTLKIRVERID